MCCSQFTLICRYIVMLSCCTAGIRLVFYAFIMSFSQICSINLCFLIINKCQINTQTKQVSPLFHLIQSFKRNVAHSYLLLRRFLESSCEQNWLFFFPSTYCDYTTNKEPSLHCWNWQEKCSCHFVPLQQQGLVEKINPTLMYDGSV